MAGSKAGYVVDVMQNAGTDTLEAGDIVTIVGNGPPVLGSIPVVTVKKASTNPGYAIKGNDRVLASGATIGKALGALDSGTGTIPVMVTLK